MWQNFQKALEKKIKEGSRSIANDKHLVLKTSSQVFEQLYGKIGINNIVVFDFKNKKLLIKCQKAIWKMEIQVNENKIKKRINTVLKQEVVNKIILIS